MLNRTVAIENYWARVVRDTTEFQQIALAENPEFNRLLGCIHRILQDAFINDATEYGVGRWESILGLHPSPTSTREQRKIAILTFLSVRRPYTMRVLEDMLTAAIGEGNFKMNLVNDTQTLHVAVNAGTNVDDVYYLIQRVVPQNLDLKLEVTND